jgi:hypothetical protein
MRGSKFGETIIGEATQACVADLAAKLEANWISEATTAAAPPSKY